MCVCVCGAGNAGRLSVHFGAPSIRAMPLLRSLTDVLVSSCRTMQRDHSIKLPKRIHHFALRVALSVKYAQGDLMIVEDLEMDSFKTKGLSTAIKKNGA